MHTASDIQTSNSRTGAKLLPAAARLREEHDDSETIIGVPYETPSPLRSLLLDPQGANEVPERESHERLFKIRAASSGGQRSSASILINKMYATRGYTSTGLPTAAMPHRMTLVACEDDDTLGTISVGFDSDEGLNVDDLFREEVDGLRDQGRKVCEFTKLAMDNAVKSRRVLASLFHTAYIVAHRLKGFQDLLIEVNPRHVRYYERMLGFVVRSSERLNRRVNAPAVLLSLDFAHAREQIARFGGRPHLSSHERSLYPFFFAAGEEAGIMARLRRR